MWIVNECVGCGSQNVYRSPSRIAPFVARRTVNWHQLTMGHMRAVAVHCRECGLTHSDVRFDDVEMARLYRGYRDDAYQRERQAFESWYTPEVNVALGSGADEMADRKEHMTAMLCDFSIRPDSVLDYGGDRGQWIPDCLAGAKRYVYDLSGVEPVPGVIGLAAAHDADLVMCCQVLEHVSYPLDVLRELRRLARRWVYIEVPAEHGDGPPIVHRAEFHEHITIWTADALQRAMTAAGMSVAEVRVRTVRGAFGPGRNIMAIARVA